MAWLTGWTYRKSHVINYASGAETLYQKQITVHYGSGTDNDDDVYLNSHCRTDFGDVRFTDDDQTTLLDYWIESKVDSDNAVIWVEVADNLSTINATIYIYYGKSDATYPFGADQTQMDATFVFADHFYGSAIDGNKWTYAGNSITVSNSICQLKSVSNSDVWIKSINTFGVNYAFRTLAKSKHINSSSYWEEISFYFGCYISAMPCSYTYPQYQYKYCTYNTGLEATAMDTSADTYYIFEEQRNGSVSVIFTLDGTTKATHTSQVPTTNATIRFNAIRTNAEVDINWVLVRKYVSPEPTHGDWGNEETAGQAYYHTATDYLGGLDSKTRISVRYRVKNELLGLKDSFVRTIVKNRIYTELIGVKDTFVRTVVRSRVYTELLGIKDLTFNRIKGIYRTFTEYLGQLDSFIKEVWHAGVQHYYRTFTELIGFLDTKIKVISRYRIFSELLGFKDSYLRTKTINRTFTELLGSLDILFNKYRTLSRIFNEYLGVAHKILAIHYWANRSKYWNREHPKQRIRTNP